MKLNDTKRQVETEGFDGDTKTFGIKQSARAFEILSSNIYSDKILAVVREYGCNALDAHRAACKESVPFDVHLPNQYEPFFSIRDYGTGMSHENVVTLFTTYFESTKDMSNDFTGCLGLGSKSAFSYADQFAITSWFEGQKNYYSAYLNEDNVPQITHISCEDTDEPAGLEIHLMVKPSDFNAFKDRAITIFKRFPTLPNILGNTFELAPVEYSINTPLYRFRSSYGYRDRISAIQGAVVYPIDVESFNIPMTDLQKSVLNSGNGIELNFNIGEVNITASRERLNYDKNTQQAILNKIDEVSVSVISIINDRLKAATTLFEAKKLFAIAVRGQANLFYKDEVTFQGHKITNPDIVVHSYCSTPVFEDDGVTPKVDPVTNKEVLTTETLFNIKRYARYSIRHHVNPRADLESKVRLDATDLYIKGLDAQESPTYIIFDDVEKRTNTSSIVKYNFGDGESGDVLVFTPAANWVTIDTLYDMLEGYPKDSIILLSSLPKKPAPVKEKSTVKAEVKEVKAGYTFHPTNAGGYSRYEADVDMAKGGAYLMGYSGRILDKSVDIKGELTQDNAKAANTQTISTLLHAIRHLYNTKSDNNVIGNELSEVFIINSTHKKFILGNDKWVSAYSYMDKICDVVGKIADEELVECYKLAGMHQRYSTLCSVVLSFGDDTPKHLISIRKNIYSVAKLLEKYRVIKSHKELMGTIGSDISELKHIVKNFIRLVEAIDDYTGKIRTTYRVDEISNLYKQSWDSDTKREQLTLFTPLAFLASQTLIAKIIDNSLYGYGSKNLSNTELQSVLTKLYTTNEI